MKMENERHLPLPRQQVWDALNDAAVLQACIPGCESFEQSDDNRYDAVVNTKVGPVKARFQGSVALDDLDPPVAYTLSFQGKGGQAGFVKGSSSVRLDATEDGCRLSYSVNATLGGKLAQIGSRLVNSAAQKQAKEFFDNFLAHMGVEDTGDEGDASSGEASRGDGASGAAAEGPGGAGPAGPSRASATTAQRGAQAGTGEGARTPGTVGP